jgi:penicillin-binding protein 2
MPANAGSALAVNPQDGSILAMASFPAFDPGSFAKGIPTDEYAKLTDPKGDLPLTNRAVQGTYAPGSTFKLMTSVASLRTHIINENTVINDGGVFTLGNTQFRNAQGRSYGPVSINKAITVSSDVFFYNLGDRIWNARKSLGDPIQSTARDFGYGAKSGLPIAGEADGRVPDPASRKKSHDQRPDVYPEGNWYAGDNVNMAIGQGDTLVTPLQIADAYATFANGGTLYHSRLVLRVIDANGKARDEGKTEVTRKVDLPGDVRNPIEQGLSGAVQDPRGTAYSAFTGFDLKAFPVAGKTGTAQVAGKQDTALFAAYGPVGNPRVSVSVVLEQAGFGGQAAAPVARRVMAVVAGQPVEPIKLGSSAD